MEKEKRKGMAGYIPVYCSFDEIIPLEKIVLNPQNPNTHPENQITLLSKIIETQGWRSPIVISNRSGFVVKGHGRYMAAMAGNMNFAPVDYQDYESEAAEYADMVADNRLSELSSMKDELLADIFNELGDFDISMTGYTQEEVDDLLKSLYEDDGEEDLIEQETSTQKYELVIACSGEAELSNLFRKFQEEGFAVQKKITKII